MSIQAPTSNTKFSDSQTQQIEEFKTQQLNLQTDITIHSQTLRTLQINIVGATKELNGLTDKKSTLEKEVTDLQTKADTLKVQVQESTKTVETARQEADTQKNLHTATQADLDSQKADLKTQKAQIQTDRESLDKVISDNIKTSQELAQKKALITELASKL